MKVGDIINTDEFNIPAAFKSGEPTPEIEMRIGFKPTQTYSLI